MEGLVAPPGERACALILMISDLVCRFPIGLDLQSEAAAAIH